MTFDATRPGRPGQITKPLASVDRLALASAALSILRLPDGLQDFCTAYDMLRILDGQPCGDGKYILKQAHRMLHALCWPGWADALENEEIRGEVEKFVAEALAKCRELIAEAEAF
jgi:hypothetical protein